MVIAFPNLPRRAWLIEPSDDGGFVGRFIGKGFHGPKRTEPGPMALIFDALSHPSIRRGLPIIVHEDCNGKVAA